MGFEHVERFFKLTLDNVYRFSSSLLFMVALLGAHKGSSPIEGLTWLLNWLAIPSKWLAPVGEWLTERQAAVGVVATLTLLIAIGFASTGRWLSRTGATALLSIVFLMQVRLGWQVFIGAISILGVLVLISVLRLIVVRPMGWDALSRVTSEGMGAVWEKVGNVLITLIVAVTYLISPLGWLISQEPYNLRGTSMNPLYIKQN